ncbi:MAG: M28 family peptidase [Haloferacaceae archaeon]
MDTDWIGRTFVSDVGWSHLRRLTDIGSRMAGTAGERAGLEATRDALADAGARDAGIEEFEIRGWERGASRVRAGDEAFEGSHQCIALPRSPPGSATGDLVDLGHGLPEDVADADLDGAVVLVRSDVPESYERSIHRREKYYRAVEAGAAAFLFQHDAAGALPQTGSVGTPDAPIGEIPALGVSYECGARLRRHHGGDAVTVEVECEVGEATSGNVHAELGPDTDEAVLVTSHVDGHDISEGAADNAAGTATVVEMAAALAAREADLDTRVRFVCFGAEEVGLLGSAHEAERTDPGTVKAVLNVDSNVAARDLLVHTNGFDGLRGAVERVADRLGHPASVWESLNTHSDHWSFVARGVPGAMVTADSARGDRGWGHTHADTLDKLEPRTLREQAILLTELVVEVADADTALEHRTEADVADELERENLAEGMQLTGDWPY